MDQSKLIAAALRRMQSLKLDECFDANNIESVPTEDQLEVFKDISKVNHRYCRGGNQCLAKGTKVLTSVGIKNIEDIQVGDLVYDEYGKPIRVKQTFENGLKEVVELTNRGQVWAEATDNHTFLTSNSSKGGLKELRVSEFVRDTGIHRVEVDAPMGTDSYMSAYSIGALLGDGCSRQAGNYIHISSDSYHIPTKVAQQIDGTIIPPKSNYTWKIKDFQMKPVFYDSWCNGRYAHQKTVDLEEVKNWDRQSLVALTAGIIDTDGSVYIDKWDTLTIQCEMQAKSVIEYLQWAFLSLWQTPTSIQISDREKYVNGPCWTIKVANNAYTKRMLFELDAELVTPHKKWKPEYSDLVAKRTNPNCIGISKGTRRIVETYDIHVDSATNLYCLANGLVTHNSGKSQVLRREVAWMFERKHPYFTPPADWSEDEPRLILLVGKTRRMLEDSLWAGIKRFLKPGTYKEVKVGPYLEKIEHKETGDTIILLSHDNPSVAVERMQSYSAHYIGLDEMPTSYKVIEELHRRGQAKAAPFLASFTPKSQNIQIKKLVDAVDYPYGKVYKLRSLDNPVMSTKKKKDLLESVKSYSESYQRTILEGEWMIGERAVYQFNPEVTIESPPQTYHKGWRHIESSDPAVSSKFGFTLWAEDPATGLWYCIRDEYVEGLYVPEKIFQHVQELTRGYNILKRICDPHETWYINTARSHGIHYQTPFDKNSRKNELIKGLQSAMISEIRIAPWCERLIEELSNCQFREDSDKIVNASSYHLLDTAQYFVDLKPAHDPELAPKSWEVELREANQKRKEKKASLAKQRINTGRKGRTIAQWQRRRSSL
jgi:hypothetical protein